MQHSLVAWVTPFHAPEEDAGTNHFLFSARDSNTGCSKAAGQPQPFVGCWLCQGGLSPHRTGEAVWVESPHRVWSIPRWGLLVNVYV